METSEWKRIPERYRVPVPAEDAGEVTEFFYKDGATDRRALVYLPRGYARDTETRYPVFYLMHGGGGCEKDFFVRFAEKEPVKNMLDHMITEGVLRPLIVVTPTFYRPVEGDNDPAKVHAGDAKALTESFWRELNDSLIPSVDAAFRTEASRDARAFGGFSMGAEATWSVLCWGGRAVRYYLPMSGDFWGSALRGGADRTAETCDFLIEGIRSSSLSPEDYEVFAATGTNDIAYDAMRPMVEELLTRSPWFSDADNGGNLTWRVSPGWHSGEWCLDYMWMALPRFFPGEKEESAS